MSIASEIERIESNIAAAYTACSSKGAALPQVQNSANLSATISGISVGVPVEARTYNQMNTQAKKFVTEVSYDPTDYSYSSIDAYNIAVEYRKDRPEGTTVTIPSSGTITVQDGSRAFTAAVSAGAYTIRNLTPGHTCSYTVRAADNSVIAAGTVRATGSLRMIDGDGITFNIRDLGGYACDGGTLKYGLVFRGCELSGDNYYVNISEDQKSFFRDFIGIRDEIDLRGNSEVDGDDDTYGTADDITGSVLGSSVDYLRCPIAPYAAGVNLENKVQTDCYAALLKRIASDISSGKPCYIHCMAGADRTGTLCALIEAICGVGRSDIDKDYEITSFSSGNRRLRTDSDWIGFISRINSFSGNTFRDKVVGYALQAGVTIDEINALRKGLIDGTPSVLTSPYPDVAVSRVLAHATSDNTESAAVRYQPYEANLTPDDGYIISDVRVTMNGADITAAAFSGTKALFRHRITNNLTNCITNNSNRSAIDGESYGAVITALEGYTLENATVTIMMGGNNMSNYYSDGKITIPRVTGDLVITVQAASSAPAYTNQIPISTDASGNIYNGTGYKDGQRINSSGTEVTAGQQFLLTGFIPFTCGDTIRVSMFGATATDKQSAGIWFFDAAHALLGARRLTDMISSNEYIEGTVLVYTPTSPIYDGGIGSNRSIANAAYIRICFHDKAGQGADLTATINEEIA